MKARDEQGDDAEPPGPDRVAEVLLGVCQCLVFLGWFLRLSTACIERMRHANRLAQMGREISHRKQSERAGMVYTEDAFSNARRPLPLWKNRYEAQVVCRSGSIPTLGNLKP